MQKNVVQDEAAQKLVIGGWFISVMHFTEQVTIS